MKIVLVEKKKTNGWQRRQAEIDYLKEFKQRLISDAVTGQICVAEPQKGDAQ